MALEEILAAIEDEAASTIASIETDAAARVAAAMAEATNRAEIERKALETGRDEAAARARARIVNLAVLEADRAVRAAREGLFQEAIGGVAKRLAAVRSTDGYEALFERLLGEARAALPDAEVAEVGPSDVELAALALRNLGWQIRVGTKPIEWGGFDLSAGDGRAVRNTFATRLHKAMPELRRLAVSLVPELGAVE